MHKKPSNILRFMTCLPRTCSMRSFPTTLLLKDAWNLIQTGNRAGGTLPVTNRVTDRAARQLKLLKALEKKEKGSPNQQNSKWAFITTLSSPTNNGKLVTSLRTIKAWLFFSLSERSQPRSHPVQTWNGLICYKLKFLNSHRFGPTVTRTEFIYISPVLLAGVASVKPV